MILKGLNVDKSLRIILFILLAIIVDQCTKIFVSKLMLSNNFEDITIFFNDFSLIDLIGINTIYFLFMIFLLNYFQKYITVHSLNKIYHKLNKIFVVSLSLITIIICIILSKGSSQKFIYFNF